MGRRNKNHRKARLCAQIAAHARLIAIARDPLIDDERSINLFHHLVREQSRIDRLIARLRR